MGCDNLIDGAQVLQQFEVPLDKETIPLPMDVSGTKERLGDVVTKVGQNIKEAQDPPEATSPHKSSKPAQIYAANETQQTSQGAMKAQTGRG